MTAAELISELQKLPADTVVKVSVANPNDTAYSDEVQSVSADGNVRAWVRSDNEGAFAPWDEDKYEEEEDED